MHIPIDNEIVDIQMYGWISKKIYHSTDYMQYEADSGLPRLLKLVVDPLFYTIAQSCNLPCTKYTYE